MLGRLARRLRALGYDPSYDERVHEPELVAIAARENRVLLTRDRHLLRELRPARGLGITSEVPLEQLRQVVDVLHLELPPEPFTRSLICNTLLVDVPREHAMHMLLPDSRDLDW